MKGLNLEITNLTLKNYNVEVIDKLEVQFNATKYNITANIKVPLNNIMVIKVNLDMKKNLNFKILCLGKFHRFNENQQQLSNSYKN